MDRSQRISKILDKINNKFHRVFEWLTCEDLGRDWEGVGTPYAGNRHIVGQDGAYWRTGFEYCQKFLNICQKFKVFA
jgi:hypothetical protein